VPGARVAQIAGGGLLLLGAAVLAAWAAGSQPLIQIHTRFQPLHANAALGLCVWGTGLLAAARAPGVARACAALLAVWGVGGVLCPAIGVGEALNTWAFPADPLLPPFPPGGMGVLAGAAFVLGGVGVWVMARRGAGEAGAWVLAGTGAGLVLGAAVVAVNSPVLLGAPNRPGPPLVLQLAALLGGAAVTAAGARAALARVPVRSAVPVGLWVGGVGASLILWDALVARQDARVHRTVQLDGADAQLVLEKALDECTSRLRGEAERVRAGAAPEAAEVAHPALSLYYGSRRGVVGVARLVPGHPLRWLEPVEPVRVPHGLDAAALAADLNGAVEASRPAVVRPPRASWNGNWVLLLYSPVRPGVGAEGGLLAVLEPRAFLAAVLNQNVAPGYALEVRDGPDLLYSRDVAAGGGRRYTGVQRFRAEGLDWQFRVWPTEAALEREGTFLPHVALAAGVGLVTLLSLAVHLAQTAGRRAAALGQSEARHRSLSENLEQGVFLKDAGGLYQAANPSYCRLMGRAEAELVGRADEEVTPTRGVAAWVADEARVLAEGKTFETECEWPVADQVRTVRRMLTPVRDARGRPVGVLGIVWDVTEQRALEARLRQTGKLDALGQLAGGIAHDFNNLLTAIGGNLELIRFNLRPGDENEALVEAAQGAVGRAAALAGRLLGFARQHHLDRQPTDLGAVAAEVVALLRRTIDPRVRIETCTPPGLGPVLADPNQMNQVLMNLCLNARDAIDGAGCVRIETTEVEFRPGSPAAGGGRMGRFVRLRVGDDGAGMTPEVRARIFEPFFTTKGVGKGTGLGLAMVHGIVEQHDGWIGCDSRPGFGTRFDIYLPVTTQPTAPATAPDGPDPVVPDAAVGPDGATVLVVDDEAVVRRVGVTVLRQYGYEVLEAADGAAAVELYAREGHRIDLVVLDLTMPVMSGQDAFREIRTLDPQARVLFVSGYASEQLGEEEIRATAGFLKKPYRPQELVQMVRDALESDRPDGRRTEVAGTGPTPQPAIA
jgi:PAS domain S-box-containing protein